MMHRVRLLPAAVTVLAAAAAAAAGLQASGLADAVSPQKPPAEAPAPAVLPAVTLPADETVADTRARPLPLPDVPTVAQPSKRARFKTCALPAGRSIRVRRGTPCPNVGAQIDEQTRRKLQQRRQAQQPATPPQTRQPAAGQQQPSGQPPPVSDGSGGAKYPGQ